MRHKKNISRTIYERAVALQTYTHKAKQALRIAEELIDAMSGKGIRITGWGTKTTGDKIDTFKTPEART